MQCCACQLPSVEESKERQLVQVHLFRETWALKLFQMIRINTYQYINIFDRAAHHEAMPKETVTLSVWANILGTVKCLNLSLWNVVHDVPFPSGQVFRSLPCSRAIYIVLFLVAMQERAASSCAFIFMLRFCSFLLLNWCLVGSSKTLWLLQREERKKEKKKADQFMSLRFIMVQYIWAAWKDEPNTVSTWVSCSFIFRSAMAL